MNEVFFAKYDQIFGSSLNSQRSTSPADRALVLATSALNMAASSQSSTVPCPSLMAAAHLSVGASMCRSVLEKRESVEDKLRTKQWDDAGAQATTPTTSTTTADADADDADAQASASTEEENNKQEVSAGEAGPRTARPLASEFARQDFSFDGSDWSPRWLVSCVRQHVLDSRLKASEPEAGKKGVVKGKTPAAAAEADENAAERQREEEAIRAKLETPPPLPRPLQLLRSKAISHLFTAVAQGLQADEPRTVSGALLELCNVYGCTQPALTAQYLSYYLASEVRAQGLRLLQLVGANSSPERAALARRAFLSGTRTHASREKLLLQRYLSTEAIAYKRLLTNPLSPQHNADGTTLAPSASDCQQQLSAGYQGMLDKLPESSAVVHMVWDDTGSCLLLSLVCVGAPRAGVVASDPMAPAYVSRTPFTPAQAALLKRLISRWAKLRQTLQKRVLLYNATDSKLLDDCQEQFDSVVSALGALLSPCFARALVNKDTLAGRDVVLMTDKMLFDFPLEALPILADAHTITREYSLSLLFQRIVGAEANDLAAAAGGGGGKGAAAAPATAMGYVVDPYLEEDSGRSMSDYQAVTETYAKNLQVNCMHRQRILRWER